MPTAACHMSYQGVKISSVHGKVMESWVAAKGMDAKPISVYIPYQYL